MLYRKIKLSTFGLYLKAVSKLWLVPLLTVNVLVPVISAVLYKNGGAGAETDSVTVMYFLLPISAVWTSIFVSEFFFSDRTRDVLFFYSRKKRFAVSQLFFLLPLVNVAAVTLLHFRCLSYSVSMAVKLLCIGVLFYGIAMLDKFKGTGLKKIYLIFGMCDETFSINCTADIPESIDKGDYMLFVTLLNQFYWVFGATLGGLCGSFLTFDTAGLDFVMTAMFTVIFTEQWMKDKNHLPALAGLALPLICLVLFGKDSFILPSMLVILAFLTLMRPMLDSECRKFPKGAWEK